MMPEETPRPNPETVVAHWAEDPRRYLGAVVPPIFQNSLFTFKDSAERLQSWMPLTPLLTEDSEGDWLPPHGYDYTRVSNPTTDIAEAKIAALEGGDRARCFGSGMAAISAAILSCVQSGDHVVCVDTVYGPTRVFLTQYLPRFGITTTFIDGCNPKEWQDAIQPDTALFFLETPSSVVMKQQDLAAVVAIARRNATRPIATICDNSWASPIFQNPLAYGVDLVVHSATKYLGGHSDIIAGVAVGNEERMRKLIAEEGCLLGAVLDPFAAWLLLRGLRTLPIRMERHQRTAQKIAHALSEHPSVARVFYPGSPHDPQPELTTKQLRGTSGLLSFLLKDSSRNAAHKVVDALKYFAIGCSWGGFESLALAMSAPARTVDEAGSGNHAVIRLHIGLEHEDDLWSDLDLALNLC
jgi:cystathionine beta-lyase